MSKINGGGSASHGGRNMSYRINPITGDILCESADDAVEISRRVRQIIAAERRREAAETAARPDAPGDDDERRTD